MKKPGISVGISIGMKLLIRGQKPEIRAPEIIPAKAPARVVLFTYKLKITSGPKEAPRPNQA